MPYPSMLAIARLGVGAIELAHAFGQIDVGRMDQQLIVVIHQAPGIANSVELADDLFECRQEHQPVIIIFENVFARIATCCDVVERIGDLNS